jgi:transcriptional/translational regulatory protein YebC/TACO1
VSPEQEDRAHELIDKLEEVDDVTAVYVNLWENGFGAS